MKLQINILPAEYILRHQQKRREQIVSRLSITIVTLVVVITSTVLLLRLFQQQDLSQLRQDQADYQSTLNSFNNEANLLKTLKTRLKTINSLSNDSSPAVIGLELINRLKPAGISTSHLEIGSQGKLTYSGETLDAAELDNFFNSLTDPAQTESKITQTRIDNLTRINTGQLRFDLSMTVKK